MHTKHIQDKNNLYKIVKIMRCNINISCGFPGTGMKCLKSFKAVP